MIELLHRRNGHHKYAKAAGAMGAILAARASIPSLLTRLVNRMLQHLPGYSGRVEHVGFSFLRGEIHARGMTIAQIRSGRTESLAYVDHISLNLSVKHLMKGGLVGDILITHPQVFLNLERGPRQDYEKPAGPEPMPKDGEDTECKTSWQQKVRNLLPFQLSVAVEDGEVYAKGLPGQNGEDISVREIRLHFENLTNSPKLSAALMSRLRCHLRVASDGEFALEASGYPLAKDPTFNVDCKLQNLDLSEFASLIRHSTGLDVRQGVLELYMEAAAKDGQLQGYAKPVIDRLHFEKGADGLAHAAKSGVVGSIVRLLQNHKANDRIATRVNFNGSLNDPQVDTLGALYGILRNAFSQSLQADLENRIWYERAGKESADTTIHFQPPQKSKLRVLLAMIKESFSNWSKDSVPRMAASLSYYTAFSIAPLLLLVISIAGLAFGKEAAQGEIVGQLTGLVGRQSAEAIQSMVQAANHPAKGIAGTLISLISLLFGASGVLSELKRGLNTIWRAESPSGFKALIRQNLKNFGLLFAIGFILLISLAVSAGLATMGKWMESALPVPEIVLQVLNFVVSFGIVTALFATLYKYLPTATIGWKDVWVGAAVTSLLFTIGKSALGLYLGKGTVGSSYGSAGSILIVLLWVYYSGLIFYLGAEFTKLYTDRFGTRKKIIVQPSASEKAA